MKLNNPRRWFWLTLRLVSKAGGWFTRGVRVCAVLSTRCPLKCSYCPMTIYNPVKRFEECSFEEWKVYFQRFPHRISLVYLSGGETSLYKDIVPLTNWLIEKGHHVIIFSNLWKIENFQGIKPHWRLIFFPTYHAEQDNPDRYAFALSALGEKYNVYSTEFEKDTLKTKDHSIKNFWSKEWFETCDDTLHLAPNTPRTLALYTGCVNLYKDGK
jgi:hypothetical protein